MDNSHSNDISEESIAIIGMSGRFPGAKNTDEFWQNLKNGVESITFFSDQELIDAGIDPTVLKDSNYVKAKGILDNVANFDAAFFGLSPTEAQITDPQQRLFLECAWEALENAGYDPKTYTGLIGVYGGIGTLDTYLFNNLFANHELRKMVGDFQIGLNNSSDSACTRTSYKLNLRGPSVSIQTACSTSLVAVAMGYQSLLDYQCDIVLAGGASISFPQKSGYLYQEGMIFSPDGHCRAFDAKAGGTIDGSGAGIVVLKRLADALDDGDMIHAVIRGAAINNDGALKVGYTAPSVEGQTRVITEALTMAEVSPETISYVETHGTGTPLGDPIEIAALTQAFRTQTNEKGYCAISCAKTNIGHLDAASGVTGLIKVVLALKHQLIPPLLHFETPNPKLDLANSPFYINTELSEWKTVDIPRRAGVSSFGIGGTNAHVILEEAPFSIPKTQKSNRPWQLLLLSAKTDTALETATTQLVEYLKQHPELNLADVAYTYQIGRSAFSQRRTLICETLEDVVNTLETRDTKRILTQVVKEDKKPSVVFMFSGQGTQYVNMGLELYQTESIFRKSIDDCAKFLKSYLELDLRTVLYPNQGQQTEVASQKLKQTAITQPALFVIEYALAQLWQTWGIQPKAMIGHSIGEYVAACLAGVFTLEEALILVAARGRLIQSVPAGAMLAVPLAEEEIRPFLNQHLDLAALNTSLQSIVSGTFEAVEQLVAQLAEQGIECQRLHTSHAFHSEMMSPILNHFLEQIQKIQLKPPKIPFLSNVTGTWINDNEAIDPNYWVKHLRQTVHFAAGLQQILQKPQHVLLEVGPGRTLSTFAKRHPDNSKHLVLTSLRHPKDEQPDSAFLLNTLGKLWMAGITVNWSKFHQNEQRYRLPLPTYPFERQRYWIDAPKQVVENQQVQKPITASSQLWKSLIGVTYKQAQQGVAEFDNSTYVEKYQGLNRLSAAYVNLALRELGAFIDPTQQYSVDELLQRFSILPFYRQLLPRCLNALVKQGHLQQQDEQFSHLIPFSRDELEALIQEVETRWDKNPELPKLVQLCGEKFAAILTGEENPRELLFTGIGFNLLQNLYQNSSESRYFSTIGQVGIKQIVQSLPSKTNLNILEIGAGTGASTAYLLPELPSGKTHYVFTDIGPSFLNQAKQKFSEYPYLEYRLLDIEQNPTEQGFENHRFDVVIAMQVLHATKNLGKTLEHIRSLLVPGGILLLWEITQWSNIYFDVFLPILQPFEEKDELRSHSYYSFFTREQWYNALRKYGFIEIESFPQTNTVNSHILMAQASYPATQSVSTFTEKVVQPKTVHTLKKKSDITDWFYIPSWKRSILPSHSQNKTFSQQCWLVFIDEYGFGAKIVKKLEQDSQSVITVRVGTAFSSLSNDHNYTLNPQRDVDYEALLKALHTINKIPTAIIHLWNTTLPDDKSDIEQLEKCQNLGFYSLLFLAQALGKQNITDTIQINVVSNNLQKVTGHEVLCPEKATLLGPCRVIPEEYQNIICRSIDIVLPDLNTSAEEMLIERLLSEFSIAEHIDSTIAYRDNERWVSNFEAVRLEKDNTLSKIREKGVYFITGGLGGIGLTLAEYLAKTVHAKLILTMRSVFPVKNEWQQWLSTHHGQDEVSRKIRKLQTIETLGAEVLIIRADVANVKQMQAVITQSLEKFGQIHGVIHTAGIPGGGVIQRKTRKTAESVLSPKVKGTRVLDIIFKKLELDFLVLCSSLDSILGVFGQVDYCAANAFLNAFADSKASKNNLIVSINWDGWQEVGMAAEAKKQYAGTPTVAPKSQYQEVAHPLFDRVIMESSVKTIYISHLSILKQWVLNEHQVMGKATLPGTAYLEMARAAFENQTNHHGIVEIKAVYFLAPLTVEEEKEVWTILTKQEKEFEFVISSQTNSETWQEHARGQVALADMERPEQYDLTALEENCQEQEIVVSQDTLISPTGIIEFGPRWNNLKQIKLGLNQGLAFLELPELFSTDLNQYQLHPALLDVATSFTQFKNEDAYLPFSYKKLRIIRPLPAKIYSYITFAEHNSSNTLKLNIKIMDEQGQGLIEIEDYTLRRVDTTAVHSEKQFSESDNFSLKIASPGLLDTLTFYKTIRQQPGPNEIEIEVNATGLNFKEVLWALGVLPSDTAVQFGLECVGKIVALGQSVKNFQIGDEVIAFTENGFSCYTTTSASSVVLKPALLSMEEAVTVPVSFMTAYYALHHLARLCKGERVLIHAASGGVGLAAVQIAQMVGAEIFATAGNPEKRAFLHSLGIEHVMDSRNLAFAEEIMKRTKGEGVNVVLNSLVGDFIPKSLSVLAPFGRFLEIGRRDIYENTPLGLQLLEKGLSFFVVNLGPEIPNFSTLFNELMQHFKEQRLNPLPHRVFPITEIVNAFQYMAQSKHIGKIVVYQNKKILKTLVSKEATRQSNIYQQGANHLLSENLTTSNVFQEDLKDGLLSIEGIEVFKRTLHSKYPQIFISTQDLYTRLEKTRVSSLLVSLEEKSATHQSKLTHSRSQLNTTYVAPRNELEKIIIEAWKKFFCIDNIGVFDDFFELGGDSLMAVQLVAELRRSTQVELSAHSLLENPTIAALVESIQTVEDVKIGVDLQSLPHSLVKIQAGNSLKQPIFLVHPIGGHIYIYRDLANSLGNEQPVYGFKAKGIDEEAQPLTQIEEMATHYINALRVIQPEGPYIIGGHSFGGFVAFEMAQQLSALGQEVALLFMMDTIGPEHVLIDNQDSDNVKLIAYALGLDINIDFSISAKQFSQLPLEEKIRYFYEQSDIVSQVCPFDEFIFHTRHFIEVIKANNQAMNNYVPKTYQGKILFFRAQEVQFLPPNLEHGWSKLTTKGLDIHEVHGNHTSMNFSPNVEIIAKILRNYLDKQ